MDLVETGWRDGLAAGRLKLSHCSHGAGGAASKGQLMRRAAAPAIALNAISDGTQLVVGAGLNLSMPPKRLKCEWQMHCAIGMACTIVAPLRLKRPKLGAPSIISEESHNTFPLISKVF